MNPEGFLMFSEVMLPHRYCTKWYGTKWQDYKRHNKAATHTSESSFINGLSHRTKECGSLDPTMYSKESQHPGQPGSSCSSALNLQKRKTNLPEKR